MDLVLCKNSNSGGSGISFADLGAKYGVVLNDSQKDLLSNLPTIAEGQVGPVLMALEAKACMTAHIKALPRLYDELSSSQITVHGDTSAAISVGFVMVNVAPRFLSPLLNQRPMGSMELDGSYNKHRQPEDALRVIQKVKQLPRSAHDGDPGYDALGITLVDAGNDGSEVRLVEGKLPYPVDEIFTYEFMVKRSAHWYATRFGRI